MGYFDSLKSSGLGDSVLNLAKESSTFKVYYTMWVNYLLERAMRLFTWENTETEDSNKSIKPKHLESILLLNGSVGITDKWHKKLTAFYGTFSGVTEYYDEYSSYNVRSPLYSQMLQIDNDIIVIDNNACRNNIYDLIHRYAIMLAHSEVTLVNMLVNLRDGGNTPVASTETQRNSIIQYRNKLFNGRMDAILDPAFMGVEFKGNGTRYATSISEIMETRTQLLESFFNDIGVKTSHEKKGNMIVEEVESNNSMLLLNIKDMLYAREKGAEKVNKKYGTNWSVKISEEIDLQGGAEIENINVE